jgi:PAS domain S-box-containing protein
VHKNVLDFFTEGEGLRGMLTEAAQGGQSLRHALLRRTDGAEVPVEVSCVALTLMNKRFIQVFVRDISAYARLERRLEEKEREVAELRARLSAPSPGA